MTLLDCIDCKAMIVSLIHMHSLHLNGLTVTLGASQDQLILMLLWHMHADCAPDEAITSAVALAL